MLQMLLSRAMSALFVHFHFLVVVVWKWMHYVSTSSLLPRRSLIPADRHFEIDWNERMNEWQEKFIYFFLINRRRPCAETLLGFSEVEKVHFTSIKEKKRSSFLSPRWGLFREISRADMKRQWKRGGFEEMADLLDSDERHWQTGQDKYYPIHLRAN